MLIVGIGGTQREGSSSEAALRVALDAAREVGSEIRCFASNDLLLPLYDPSSPERHPLAEQMTEALRAADGLIVASPGYHGSISGMVKNALDYTEDLAQDPARTYLDGMPVGCIAVAHGWQAAVNTLAVLRQITHALRGMPVPFGAAINVAAKAPGGSWLSDEVRGSLATVGGQVADLAGRLAPAAAPR